jgi:RNA polymerase sigma factor (sigma-70 family)
MQDEEVCNGLLSGDPLSQLEFLTHYLDKIDHYLNDQFQNLSHDDRADIASQIIGELIQKPEKIDMERVREGKLTSYIIKIAHHRAIDLHRKRETALSGYREVSIGDSEAEQVEDHRLPYLETGQSTIEEQFPPDVVQAAHSMLDALQLTDRQSEHLRLRLENPPLSFEEIAQYLGITPNNERTSWHRLRKKIEEEKEKYPIILAHEEKLKLQFK